MVDIAPRPTKQGPGHDITHGLSPSDRRGMIPETGLREYWYPGIPANKVGKKPVLVKMLGSDVTFWHGKEHVVAMDNSCPHRGAMMHKSDCWWPGTISCPYHDWTFNETGDVVAVLGEGPDSKIHGKVTAKMYPTVTLKGVVFVWMGEGEPAPIEEDVPPELFDDRTVVLHSNVVWPTNWRPAMENIYDSHVAYVHRDSFQLMAFPIFQSGPSRDRPEMINGRALNMKTYQMQAQVKFPQATYKAGDERPYQEHYPLADVLWPRRKNRLLWTWAFKWLMKRARRHPLITEEHAWQGGHHLPSMFRANYGTHMYTRWNVPVDAKYSRMFYFHTTRPGSWVGRFYEWVHFHLWHDWSMNYNFSGQDGRQMIYQYYDRPEKLSATDVQTIEWRKMVLEHGRGLVKPELSDLSEAEVFAEELVQEMQAEMPASG
jgi:phenylpropionate dioxygenase-like ring-hydroxylating dioxygenase large terminal subunit